MNSSCWLWLLGRMSGELLDKMCEERAVLPDKHVAELDSLDWICNDWLKMFDGDEQRLLNQFPHR